MASGGGGHVYTSTLSGGASVDTVWLSDGCSSTRVTNLTGTAPIFFTVSHPGGPCPIPSSNSPTSYVCAPTAGNSVSVRHDGQFGSIIQLVSASVQQYMCEAQSVRATS